MCLVCLSEVETIDHLFVRCRELIDIWRRIVIWWDVRLPDQFTISKLITWSHLVPLRGGQRKAFDALVLSTFWCVWNFRNSTIFGMVLPRKSLIFDEVVVMVFF